METRSTVLKSNYIKPFTTTECILGGTSIPVATKNKMWKRLVKKVNKKWEKILIKGLHFNDTKSYLVFSSL